ncbi:GDSL-type esterase/lipase family protein [Streptomyces ficellus]|uniref:GDSL-type esterase/lipase family protein n=1 Tax=Streptomyces ficellus TaxID=1977088 RepID=A0ABT7ZEB2_9ACTN|nr:GDSL-type esterase/lipase family protein [Streptomyces ficellus]MDN3297597.1 GDSL-type esterase/lipase family protein [Streptomyces ficellus]
MRLGKDWTASADRAVTTAADSGGLKILVADSKEAYEWRTVATLAEPGMPADAWIGNACVMDREHVAAVYAPRTFTNKPDLMQGGAFTAVIELQTGTVTKLPFTASMAYFDPTCNPQTRTAAFTAFRDNKTRLITVATTGKTIADASVDGQVTSAVPVNGGLVAARGRHLVHLSPTGKARTLARADSVPSQIRPTRDGVAFLDRTGDTARAKLWTKRGETSTLASGKLEDLALKQGTGGRVFLTGQPKNARLAGSAVTRLNVPADAEVSSLGRLAVDPVLMPGVRAGLDNIQNAGKGFTKAEPSAPRRSAQGPANDAGAPTITSLSTATGQKITQALVDTSSATGKESFSPALNTTGTSRPAPGRSGRAAAADDPRASTPIDTDRLCSIPRNDVKALALQPTPNQIEWAVNMAIRGELRAKWIKQGGWRAQAGLGTVDPQGLFPPPTLKGGGRIPAQVLLGVLAQESNLWQAEGGAIPGQMGNPQAAIAGFYGHKGETAEEYWKIRWLNSDCGYGVGQVTDGMRLAGHEKPGETSLPPLKQKAVALDYSVNIAASMYILADKWNQVHTAGQTITVNNDDASKPENWFTALWNYNLGFNPNNGDGTPWGLGWYNNPANPFYPPSRHPFMTDPRDAAKPQNWPYQEKVMGWSAWSMDTGFSYSTDGRQDWPGESGYSSVGFRPAWWVTEVQRDLVKPPLDAFCNATNNCNAASPPDCPDEECYKKHWWRGSNVTWKPDCATECGNESIKYVTLREEPGRGYRLENGTPKCSPAPAGALIVESVPDNIDTYGGCGSSGTDAGHFQFTFYPNPAATGPGLGPYQAKGDLHQIGGGQGGHFWYAHTRDTAHLGGDSGVMTVKGTWTLDKNIEWARVMVHLPDTGAHTRQAAYVIGGADTTSNVRIVEQRANRWVSLGAFRFTGTPTVTLTNATADGTADEDVAWDAVAFQPLPGKPNHIVTAMGDSYSSGEGASDPGGDDYYPESDYYNKVSGDKTKNTCHRSRHAWPRRAVLPGEALSVGELADPWSPRMDFQFTACSGARHYNILSITPDSGELPQIQQGYLDQHTTLVALSIGGNDMAFADVIKKCITAISDVCQNGSIKTRNPDTGMPYDTDTPELKRWLPAWAHTVIRPRLVKTLRALHEKAPNAKIVLMGYPRLLEKNGSCVVGIGTEEAPWLNEMGDVVATEMKGAVSDAGSYAVFADPRSAFAGQAICGDPETIHGITLTGHSKADTKPISMKSFHPKVSGTAHYAKAFQDALAQ